MSELWTSVVGLLQGQLVGGGLVLMLSGAFLALLRRAPQRLLNTLWERSTLSLEVRSEDNVFDWMLAWLDAQPYTARARRLTVTSSWSDEDSDVRLHFAPAPGRHLFWYGTRLVVLQREIKSGEYQPFTNRPREHMTLTVVGRSQETLRKLVAEARDRRKRLSVAKGVYVAVDGHWARVRDLGDRPLDTVVLPNGQESEVAQDLRNFLNSREWYESRGIPWRRGYLLHGPPGSGKTTLIAAVAGAVGCNLGIIGLSSRGMNDETLLRLMLDAPEETAIVMEDIDVAVVGRSVARADDSTGVTFTGLLNVLDGIAVRPGQVVWMTTNHLEVLDPALVRPGRMDVNIEFRRATPEQAERLFVKFYGDGVSGECVARFGHLVAARGATMAEVQQHLLAHRDSAVEAVESADAMSTRYARDQLSNVREKVDEADADGGPSPIVLVPGQNDHVAAITPV